jgi:PHD/YefM family antitoxin component YafN of YafNO toxin-antitoxin module
MYALENKSVEYFDQITDKLLELSSIKNGQEIKKILRSVEEGSVVKCKRIL